MMEQVSTKRRFQEISCTTNKQQRLFAVNAKLQAFEEWCSKYSLVTSPKVRIGEEGSCAQCGMVAREDITKGECLFEIPRNLLLSPVTCGISELLEKEKDALKSASGWVPLLAALMYDYNRTESPWRPYLDLVPDFSQLDLPMLWQKGEMEKELVGTGVCQCVQRDEVSITHEFNTIVLPFVNKYPQLFTAECRDINFYKRMVAFVMAYSFTEPTENQSDSENESDDGSHDSSPPMMVPMADILNHVAKNNAHLDFGTEALTMVATKDIKQGEEIFNTYGELANFQLLHMYGFSEAYPNNHYDIVEFPLQNIKGHLEESGLVTMLEEKWAVLMEKRIVTEGGAFVLGVEGILTEDELSETLKVLCMNKEELSDYRKDDWVEDNDVSLLNDDISKLPAKWKELLSLFASKRLKEYPTSLQEEENLLRSALWDTLSRRQQFCAHVRYGQKKLLTNFLELCQVNE